MDIGLKIKEARLAAQLTQEQVAESLGVSRQTISNWENNKTYPDIVSVIKISDLYKVSLDHLLKEGEDKTMSSYVDYLEESTNTVKHQRKLSQIILIATYLGIWAFALIEFWVFMSPTDALGYALVFFWMILPVATIVISFLIGKNNYFGELKWLLTIAFGFMHMLAGYATFSLKNMIARDFDVIHLPDFQMMLVGAFFSALGMGISVLIRHIKSTYSKKRENNSL